MNAIDNTLHCKAEGWLLQFVEECPSTNDAARDLPAGHAVVARRQSAGRGRLGRSWQSGEGGVWMSAVVTAPINHRNSKLMPLAAGYSVSRVMWNFGIGNVRMRWPNDVMINSRKCAGILVDRFHPDRCVVGIGINVLNDPTSGDIGLLGQTTRLNDLVSPCPSVGDVVGKVLSHLRQVIVIMDQEGPGGLISRLRPFWKIPSRVVVKSGTEENAYGFFGVDDEGRVLLKSATGSIQKYSPEEIEMLREI